MLSAISKISECLIYKQICLFAYRLLSNLLCVFREGHSAEHALFRLTKICRKANGRVVEMVLMDLSKTYGCIPDDLLIGKLAACGFGHYSLLLIHNYLTINLVFDQVTLQYISYC